MRSDEERLEIIRRTQAEMHSFDRINISELLAEATERSLRARIVFHAVMRSVIKEKHSPWERIGIEWRSSNEKHVKTCGDCQKLLGEVIRQLKLTHKEEAV